MKKSDFLYIIFIIGINVFTGYNVGYVNGYEKGKKEGVTIALDTVLSIANKHVGTDSVAKIIINENDTNVFYLSKKTLVK